MSSGWGISDASAAIQRNAPAIPVAEARGFTARFGKWYRNLLVARTLVSTLRQYKDEWEAQLVERGERELVLLAQLGHLEQSGNRKNKRSK